MKHSYEAYVLFLGRAYDQQKKNKQNMNTEHYWDFFSLKMKTELAYLQLCADTHPQKQQKPQTLMYYNLYFKFSVVSTQNSF